MLMERNKLVEKRAKAGGLGDLHVSWAKVAGPSIINDGLVSGSVHFAATGAPSLITLWDKSNGTVKGMSSITTYPLYLITRNPQVKSIKDFGEKDKIAVPSIKVSTQAILLQMAASKAWGPGDGGAHHRLQPVPRRESEDVPRVLRGAVGSDRDHQQGQAGGGEDLSRAGAGQEEHRRGHRPHHRQPGLRVHAAAREGLQDG